MPGPGCAPVGGHGGITTDEGIESVGGRRDEPATYAADPRLTLPAILRRRADSDGDQPFLVEVAGQALTYRETWQGVLRWMGALAELGVQQGQTVGSYLPQSADAHLLWLSCALLGASFVPVNPQLRGEFLLHMLRDASVRRVFARPEQVAGLREAGLPVGLPVTEIGSDGSRTGRWGRALAQAGPATHPGLPEPADVASVIYTSGTTGPAKGVLVTWGQLANAVGLHEHHPFGPADAYFTPWPPFHVMGLTPLAVMADAGGRVVIRNGPSISRFWQDIDGYRCSAATIGPIARLLMDQPPAPDDGRHTLRSVSMGPVIPDVDKFRERFAVEVTGAARLAIRWSTGRSPGPTGSWSAACVAATVPGSWIRHCARFPTGLRVSC